MPEDEEMPNTPGVLGDGILENGVDQGAARRAAIREANARRQQTEADREARRGQERAERPQRATVPGKPPTPLRGRRAPTLARVHPDGLARLPRGPELERVGKGLLFALYGRGRYASMMICRHLGQMPGLACASSHRGQLRLSGCRTR